MLTPNLQYFLPIWEREGESEMKVGTRIHVSGMGLVENSLKSMNVFPTTSGDTVTVDWFSLRVTFA